MRVAVPVEEEAKVSARRELLLGVLEREIVASPERVRKSRTRARLRRGLAIFSAAAALLGTLGIGMLISQSETASVPKTVSQLLPFSVDTTPLAPAPPKDHQTLSGRSFQTEAGHEKLIHMAGQTELVLAASTEVEVVHDSESRQDLRISGGSISLSVPEGRKPRSVHVTTAHATVIVTGTVFTVGVGRFDQPAGTPHRTRVAVARGQVLVRHTGGEVILEKGDTWLSPLQDHATWETPDRPSQALPKKPAGTYFRKSESADATSTLAAQNRLLEQALAAEAQGDAERARALIQEFLTRYPGSPLRGAALTVKKRLPH